MDGLRALAILSVVFGHIVYFNPKPGSIQIVLQAFTKTGGMGVSIFFVLSGFLISQSLLDRNFTPYSYCVRRVFKIFPPLILTMAVFLIPSIANGDHEGALTAFAANLTSIPNFVRGFREINPVHWSLWIEMQFYVLLPLTMLLFGGRTLKAVSIAALVFTVGALVVRLNTYLSFDFDNSDIVKWNYFLQRTPGSFDGFALGMLFAILHHSDSRISLRMKNSSGLLSSLGVFTLAATYCFYTYLECKLSITGKPIWWVWETFRLLPSISTFLLLHMIYLPESSVLSRIFCWQPLCLIGLVSYEWYLLHYPPAHYLQRLMGSSNGSISTYCIKTVIPILATFLFSLVVYYKFSLPILQFVKAHLKTRRDGTSKSGI